MIAYSRKGTGSGHCGALSTIWLMHISSWVYSWVFSPFPQNVVSKVFFLIAVEPGNIVFYQCFTKEDKLGNIVSKTCFLK